MIKDICIILLVIPIIIIGLSGIGSNNQEKLWIKTIKEWKNSEQGFIVVVKIDSKKTNSRTL